MCWIAAQWSTEPIPEKNLRAAHVNNNDGAGIGYAMTRKDTCKLIVHKPLWDFDQINSAYQEALHDPARIGPLVLHFRLATGGSIDALNTHPHIACRGEVLVAHNGILPVGSTKNCSDTVVWVQTVLHKRSREQAMDKRFLRHQEQFIGRNKIVLLDRFGNCRILRADLGVQMGQDWYSAPPPEIREVYKPLWTGFCNGTGVYSSAEETSCDRAIQRIWPKKAEEDDFSRRMEHLQGLAGFYEEKEEE